MADAWPRSKDCGFGCPWTSGNVFRITLTIDVELARFAMQRITHFIDGRFVDPASGQYLDNVDPATGLVYSHLPDGDGRDVELAVRAAERAFPNWSKTPAHERSKILIKIADLIEA